MRERLRSKHSIDTTDSVNIATRLNGRNLFIRFWGGIPANTKDRNAGVMAITISIAVISAKVFTLGDTSSRQTGSNAAAMHPMKNDGNGIKA